METGISVHPTSPQSIGGFSIFLRHNFLVSAVAPVLGALVSTKLGRFYITPQIPADPLWKDFLLSVIGTVLLSPLVVPFGIATYFLCRFQARRLAFGLAMWVVAWMSLGGLFAFAASAATLPVDVIYVKGIIVPVGVTEGCIIGLLLRRTWMQASNRSKSQYISM